MIRDTAAGFLCICMIVFAAGLYAQSNPASPSNPKLNEQEERGHGLFLQKCALCHSPKIQKPKTVPAIAPSLQGVLKGAKANRAAVVRNQVLKGSPNMPSFQYALESKQLDDLIAYLKTL